MKCSAATSGKWGSMTDTEDSYVLNRRVQLRQPKDGFRTGLDAVMLAAACKAKSRQILLDIGCGVGAAGLCVLARVPDIRLTGIDIQGDHVALARENAALNGVTDQTEFLTADIRDYKAAASFHHVICNPPYQKAGTHTPSPFTAKATAHTHPEDIRLEDWIACAQRNLEPKGSLTIIHRADKVDIIIRALGKTFGGIEIIPLWPKAGKPAKRVIVRALKDRRSCAALHPGIIIHEKNGDYTQAAEAILRDGAALAE